MFLCQTEAVKHLFSLTSFLHPFQLGDPAIFPAVIVEHVPGADILNGYAGLACVEEPNDMITESSLDVAEEEIIDDDDDDITLTGVWSSAGPDCSTIWDDASVPRFWSHNISLA